MVVHLQWHFLLADCMLGLRPSYPSIRCAAAANSPLDSCECQESLNHCPTLLPQSPLSHAWDTYCRCRQGAAGGGGAPPEWGPGSGGGCVQWAGKHCRLGSCPSCSPPRPLCRSTHLTVPCSRHLQVLCVKACQSMHKLDMGYKL